MRFDRPPPGEEITRGGDAAVPRQAAAVVVVRGGEDALEVLLVRRTAAARFLGGVWVFPGGAVDAGEGEGDAAHRVAALRELSEEAAIALDDVAGLVKFARWITPAAIKVRFDTHFFLAEMPAGQTPRVDGNEVVDLAWYAPQAALDAFAHGDLEIIFPTIKQLEQLRQAPSAAALLRAAREREHEVTAIEPRLAGSDLGPRLVLPGEPGYADA